MPGADVDLQLLRRINNLVDEKRRLYAALTIDEQRRSGPLLLEDLLCYVQGQLAHGDASDEENTDDERGHGAGAGWGALERPNRSSRVSASGSGDARTGIGSLKDAAVASFPFAIRDVPALAHVAALEMRLSSIVMAAIATQPIVTIYDLEAWVCAREGVDHFADLGVGVGLQVLPVVQQYFQVRHSSTVFPVRATEVVTFLLTDIAARDVLLYGGGDARDLINRFGNFYHEMVLARTAPCGDGSASRWGGPSPESDAAPVSSVAYPHRCPSPRRERLQNARQLGIHIQDYAAFLASLAQELADAHHRQHRHAPIQGLLCDLGGAAPSCHPAAGVEAAVFLPGISRKAATRRERNASLYERVIDSFDAACAEAEIVEELGRCRERVAVAAYAEARAGQRTTSSLFNASSSAAVRGLEFGVTLKDTEARLYNLPATLWQPAPVRSDAGRGLSAGGGVVLQFRVGVPPNHRDGCEASGELSRTSPFSSLEGTDVGRHGCPSTSSLALTRSETNGLEPVARIASLSPATSVSSSRIAVRRRGAVVMTDAAIAVPGVTSSTTPALTSRWPVDVAPIAVPPPSLLGSLLAPAGSQGVAVVPPLPPPIVPPEITDAAAALLEKPPLQAKEIDSGDVVKEMTLTTGGQGEERERSTPPTPLERLLCFLEMCRDADAKGSDVVVDSAPEDSLPLSKGPPAESRLENAVCLLENFAVGDRVPVALVCEAWRASVSHRVVTPAPSLCTPPAPESAAAYVHRRCVPLFSLAPWAPSTQLPLDRTPPEGMAQAGKGGAHTSRLASLRGRLGGGTNGCVPSATDAAACVSSLSSITREVADVREILYMATPAEVCWESWLPPAETESALGHDGMASPRYLSFSSLQWHYPEGLREVFCAQLGVRAAPTVAAWYTASAACVRRGWCAGSLTPCFSEAYMRSFVSCVEADMKAREKEVERAALSGCSPPAAEKISLPECQRRLAQETLRAMLDGLRASRMPVAPWKAEVFPCANQWRSGAMDGLLYAGPRWCGYDGVFLQPLRPIRRGSGSNDGGAMRDISDAAVAPPLQVLCFPTAEPSWAVCAVLRYFGLQPLAQVVETRVSFSTVVNTEAGAALLEKISLISPYVQGFCRTHFSRWYGIVYRELQERLRELRVVLTGGGAAAGTGGPSPIQTLRLHWNGHEYRHQRHLRLEYVAAQNILFGSAEATAVPVLAEALLPLFSPVTSVADTAGQRSSPQQPLRELLTELLGALSSLDGAFEWLDGVEASPQQQRQRRAQVEAALEPAATRHRFSPFTGASKEILGVPTSGSSVVGGPPEGADAAQEMGEGIGQELPFALPSHAFTRYQGCFPPGTDALRQPRGPPSNSSASSGHGSSRRAQGLASKAGAGGALVRRYGPDGRLHMSLPAPGSGGAAMMITSMPAWANFPVELNVEAVVAAAIRGSHTACSQSSTSHALPAHAEEEEGEREDEEEGEEGEGFLTFQLHRGTPGGTRKRARLDSDGHERTGRPCGREEPVRRPATWWLRPPAASVMGGDGQSTPDYAIAAERYVFELLRAEYSGAPHQQRGVRVVWVNEGSEAGLPFDVIVVQPRRSSIGTSSSGCGRVSGGGRGGRHGGDRQTDYSWEVVAYVEVKSTCTPNRQDFELSMSEVLFAARFGADYHIYRVFGASTDSLRKMRHRVYTDPVQLWYKAQLNITSDIRVTPST